ncbi:hypothetical protein QE152_g25799 [Popillia japonica]|uniref:Uncharacterized protein n=1 Tax=Popillia japonica TaxID=7064 RepID=A0AAW1K0C6_POPJA
MPPDVEVTMSARTLGLDLTVRYDSGGGVVILCSSSGSVGILRPGSVSDGPLAEITFNIPLVILCSSSGSVGILRPGSVSDGPLASPQ